MPDGVERLLRRSGVQVTAQRMALLRAVQLLPHSTADVLADRVRADIGSISRQAVYDALAVLVENGLVRRIQPAGSAARYEARVGDNHHHLICRGCGTMFDIECAVGERPCLTADDDHGFEIDEAEVIYWGRCPACRRAAETAGSGDAPTPSAVRHARRDAGDGSEGRVKRTGTRARAPRPARSEATPPTKQKE